METRRSPLRMLAPIALVVFGLALLLVVTSGGGDGSNSGGSDRAAEEARDLGGKTSTTEKAKSDEKALGKDTYIVKRGDTLGGIAESTGVPVERLQELNPGLDQFSLVAGQRIKLR